MSSAPHFIFTGLKNTRVPFSDGISLLCCTLSSAGRAFVARSFGVGVKSEMRAALQNTAILVCCEDFPSADIAGV